MARKNRDLHGSAPDDATAALLIVDLISDFAFEGGERVFRAALPVARRVRRLKQRATAAGIPTVYVNDNFGRWRSDFRELVQHCLGDVRGAPIARLLRPEPNDYFILKPKHSGFYATALDTLLQYMGVERIILTGVSSDQCVLFTANDAHVRDLEIAIPRDCVAAATRERTTLALRYFERVLKADVRASLRLDLAKLAAPPARRRARSRD